MKSEKRITDKKKEVKKNKTKVVLKRFVKSYMLNFFKGL